MYNKSPHSTKWLKNNHCLFAHTQNKDWNPRELVNQVWSEYVFSQLVKQHASHQQGNLKGLKQQHVLGIMNDHPLTMCFTYLAWRRGSKGGCCAPYTCLILRTRGQKINEWANSWLVVKLAMLASPHYHYAIYQVNIATDCETKANCVLLDSGCSFKRTVNIK